ncbi:MAG: hypothetical protein JST09_11660 [Bacteroidetes bacterium]|nr:hypothetical protein [Bacteroidota bacterium]
MIAVKKNPVIYLILLSVFFYSCNDRQKTIQSLQLQIDSLQKHMANSYKPGFGEFMSSIQVHHEKLWFAGTNQNWQLAAFEINEIKESLDDIQTYCQDRPETKSLSMIVSPLDSINQAIEQKNLSSFKNSFITLTTTCNNCHQATEHGFNVIRIPTTPPFSNQEFSPVQKQ